MSLIFVQTWMITFILEWNHGLKLLGFITLAAVFSGTSSAVQGHDYFNAGIALGSFSSHATLVVTYPAPPDHRVLQVMYDDVSRAHQPLPYAYYPAPALIYQERSPRHHFSGHPHHPDHGSHRPVNQGISLILGGKFTGCLGVLLPAGAKAETALPVDECTGGHLQTVGCRS